ncbi:MAG TPA: hypothetical protein VEV84_03130 [Pyrinomonadaceae bacterium]|nr:hypothetical protein [Pyrinomonadaceae bacterium]
MPNEETMTIHETAPDGTETTIEITSTKTDDAVDGDDKALVEEVYEAIFDDNIDDDDGTDDDVNDDGPTATNADDGGDDGLQASDGTDVNDEEDDIDDDDPASQLTPTDEEIGTDSAQFTIGEDMFPDANAPSAVDTSGDDAEGTGSAVATDDDTASAVGTTDSGDAEAADQQAHADAAKDAQDAADEFVAQGDYAAAAEARETAENESYAAGDDSMLGASDSGDLENAAYQQQNADYYRDQQAQDIAAGDYEAAKEDAQNVGAATGDADYLAGGADHTGQADKDVANLDWAVWDEKNADSAAQNADYYAAQGDFDHAETAAQQADDYQSTADGYADHADPTSAGYDYDASSAVDSGGSYDAGYDATAVDSGFDAGADASAAVSYDPGTDDV